MLHLWYNYSVMTLFAVDALRHNPLFPSPHHTWTGLAPSASTAVRAPQLSELAHMLEIAAHQPESTVGSSITSLQDLIHASKHPERSSLLLRTAEFGNARAHIIASQQGMRGMIHHIIYEQTSEDMQALLGHRLMNTIIDEFQERSIRRAHILVPQAVATNHPLAVYGFGTVEGERIQERALTERPKNFCPQSLHEKGFSIEQLSWTEQQALFKRFSTVPELAIEPWEQDAAKHYITTGSQGYLCYGVRAHATQEIVGAFFGGYAAGRGTCNHIIIEPEYRRHKLASDMVAYALPHLYDKGVRTMHIMTTAGNDAAYNFWSRQGFVEPEQATFLEADFS